MKKNNLKESWQPVPGFEGLYEASNLGEIRSSNYGRMGKVRVLKPGFNEHYFFVQLCKDGKKKIFYVHRLVWTAFNGPIPDGMTIDHINSVKRDNRLENLQLLSLADNSRKANKGKKVSEEAKAKISATLKGQTPWNKGKKHSEETKAKLRAAQKARREREKSLRN